MFYSILYYIILYYIILYYIILYYIILYYIILYYIILYYTILYYINECFSILDTASTKFQRKLKEGLYIGWEMPELNKQIKHISSSLAIVLLV